MRKGYSAVVESGSCSCDYKRWEERANCGHAHRTIEAAEKCLETHIGMHRSLSGGMECSALWYNGTIHDQDGQRVGSR
jgi:hypothetical protein